jgi:hypothetical protein
MSGLNRKFLDDKGRCCGRKPLTYRTSVDSFVRGPHRFCVRCDAAYPTDEAGQIENWAWRKADVETFERRRTGVPL